MKQRRLPEGALYRAAGMRRMSYNEKSGETSIGGTIADLACVAAGGSEHELRISSLNPAEGHTKPPPTAR